jgi:hypothetical protein
VLHRAAGEGDQFVELEGLLEKVLDPELEGLAHDLRRAVRGHHHDLRPLRWRHRLRQVADQLEPRHPRHQVVDDEQIEAALPEMTLRVVDACRFNDLVPLVSQGAAETLQDLLLVVDEQNVSPRRPGHA